MRYGIIKDKMDVLYSYSAYEDKGEDWEYVPNTVSMTSRGAEKKLRKAVADDRYLLIKTLELKD